jgi:hypothetical protein
MKIWERKKYVKKKSVPVSCTDELLLLRTSQWSWHGDQPPTSSDHAPANIFYYLKWKLLSKEKSSGPLRHHKLHNSQTKYVFFGCLHYCFVQLLEGCKKLTAFMGDYFEGIWNSSVLISCSCYSVDPWTWCQHIWYGHLKKRKASCPFQD